MRCGKGNAGNVKMRGRRRVHVFACQCCWCEDDREALREKAAKRELREDLPKPDSE